jgi:excisionase family DNA binding protein
MQKAASISSAQDQTSFALDAYSHRPFNMAYSISGAAKQIGIGRTKLYRLIKEGKIEMGKVGGQSVILGENLYAYVRSNYTALRQ